MKIWFKEGEKTIHDFWMQFDKFGHGAQALAGLLNPGFKSLSLSTAGGAPMY